MVLGPQRIGMVEVAVGAELCSRSRRLSASKLSGGGLGRYLVLVAAGVMAVGMDAGRVGVESASIVVVVVGIGLGWDCLRSLRLYWSGWLAEVVGLAWDMAGLDRRMRGIVPVAAVVRCDELVAALCARLAVVVWR